MEPSPLTQQARPEAFQPKIVELYQALFQDEEDSEKGEGFWREFFLLRPDKARLRGVLANLPADDLLHFQSQTRLLFSRSIENVNIARAPSDEIALDTLTAFLGGVLNKKYTNPSSDIISVLAGLDKVDAVFTDFVTSLDVTIRNGRDLETRQKAVEAALSVTSGAFQTSLLSYFTHRDLFPSLVKYIQDSNDTSRSFQPFLLLGLLANYNRFEFQNPYRLRLEDFVNEGTIQKIIRAIGLESRILRDGYVAVQDDLPEGWSFNSTMTFFGLGALTSAPKPAQAAPSPEAAKALFASLPAPEASILLSTYDFANANKLFCFNLVSLPADSKHGETPFAAYLSLTSYICSHAHRSSRASLYAYLNLAVLRILIEDQVLCKQICSDESKAVVRLCRQRQPYLPLVGGDRILATVILDLLVNCINYNLRRRLDVDLYLISTGMIQRLISHLSRSRTRLAYHWSELWRALLSLIRFLTTYASDLNALPKMPLLLDSLVNLIALSLSAGEGFLPGPAEYDDLFYKLVETGDTLTKFRDACESPPAPAIQDSCLTKLDNLSHRPTNSLPTLLSICEHYNELLASQRTQSRSKNLSPAQVNGVIKSGYETLSITAKEGMDTWDKYREADEKVTLKKVARVAVADVKALLTAS
ncbi:MAG: hypothetical protein M4579_005240 [Chaenotheca gracillima]|nr:MAG: hypothetical protein M4579_005240 [Chaenotheca gracillima]